MIISLDIPAELVKLIDAQVSLNRPKAPDWPFGKRVLHQHRQTITESKRLEIYYRELELYRKSLEIWKQASGSRSTVVTEILNQAFGR